MHLPRALVQPLGHMRWRDVTFAHWPAREEEVAPLVERLGHELDRHEGTPWLSVVGLVAEGPAPRWLLAAAPSTVRYVQVNLRTYVVGPHGPGLLLLRSWVSRTAASFPRLAGVPYEVDPAARLDLGATGVDLRWSDDRITGERLQGATPSAPGSLDAFLLERYWAYAEASGDYVVAVRVAHAPWLAAPATLSSSRRGIASHGYVSPGVEPAIVEARRDPARPRRRERAVQR